MKKITLLAVVAFAISFASCKKDRTCTCTITDNTTTYTTTIALPKSKKKNAEDFCSKNSSVSTTGSNTDTQTRDCKLN